MTLTGRRFHISYPNGLELDAIYFEEEVSWSVTAGPPAGRSGTDKTHEIEVGPGIYFVSWIEETGTTVSQLLNLNAMRITSFVTFDADGTRASTFQTGTLTELPQQPS
jgi:phenolic acid decarboxylase